MKSLRRYMHHKGYSHENINKTMPSVNHHPMRDREMDDSLAHGDLSEHGLGEVSASLAGKHDTLDDGAGGEQSLDEDDEDG